MGSDRGTSRSTPRCAGRREPPPLPPSPRARLPGPGHAAPRAARERPLLKQPRLRARSTRAEFGSKLGGGCVKHPPETGHTGVLTGAQPRQRARREPAATGGAPRSIHLEHQAGWSSPRAARRGRRRTAQPTDASSGGRGGRGTGERMWATAAAAGYAPRPNRPPAPLTRCCTALSECALTRPPATAPPPAPPRRPPAAAWDQCRRR